MQLLSFYFLLNFIPKKEHLSREYVLDSTSGTYSRVGFGGFGYSYILEKRFTF